MDVRMAALLAAVVLCAPVHAPAAVNALSPIGPTGGAVNKIVFGAAPNTAFLINNGGFFRSLDGGTSWQLVKSDFPSPPTDMALDASNPQRIYISNLSASALFVSTDGGASFSVMAGVPTAAFGAMKVVVSHDGSTICVASGAQLYCSADRGQSWKARGTVSTYAQALINLLIMDPEDSNSLYVTAVVSASGTATLATHDGGVTWQQLPATTMSAVGVYGLAVNPTNSLEIWAAQTDGVWMSADRGLHWVNKLATPVGSMTIDPANPAVLYAGDFAGRIYQSVNAGSAWTDVTGNLTAGEVGSIAVNASQDSLLLVGGMNGVAGSSTGGVTWTPQNTGFNGTSVVQLSEDPTTDRIYVDVPNGGLFYTANGAAAMTPVNNAALAQLETQSADLAVGPLLAQPGIVSVALNADVARSVDGGATWSMAPVAQGGDPLTALVSTASAPQVLLAASPTALYRSSDSGNTWNPVTAGLPAGAGVGNGVGPGVAALLAAPSNPNVFYYSTPAQPAGGGFSTSLTLYKSMDAGVTWSATNAAPESGPNALLTVDPTNAGILYGAGDSTATSAGLQLLKSVDGGATWTALNWDPALWSQEPLALAVDPVHPQILYVSTINALGRSVDGGASWEMLRSPSDQPWWNSWSLLVDPNRPATLLVSTAMSGVQEITFEPDLALASAAPANPVPVGVASSYGYTVSNKGPFDATGVTVRLQLPSTAQQVSATANGGTCTVTAGAVICSFAVLRTATSAAVTLTATAPSVGSFSVVGSVTGDQPDPDTTNNTLTSKATIAMVADDAVKATGTATAQVGDAVTYTLSASNAGPDTASATQLVFQLAAGITFGSVSSTLGTCSAAASTITCNLGDLPASSPVTVTVTGTAASAGAQKSTATLTTSATDLVSTNNTAAATTVVTAVPPAAASGKGGGGSLSLWIILALAACRVAHFVRDGWLCCRRL
jgi:uncharacterized repeat protein (TIGR01451 family)